MIPNLEETVLQDDDLMDFFDEEIINKSVNKKSTWKIMIIDDDEAVHAVTKIVLKDFSYGGKQTEFISAYSCKEAKVLLENNPDVALVFLDVVMENEQAGLEVVKHIRETLKNRLVRIILRTGQPGQAPEKKVVIDYDINDYKLKTELTEDRLFVAMVTALRSYKDMLLLEQSKVGLEKVIDSSAALFKIQSFREFILEVLIQLTSILNIGNEHVFSMSSGFSASFSDDKFVIEAGIGKYSECIHKALEDVLPPEIMTVLEKSLSEKSWIKIPDKFAVYFESQNGVINLIYLDDVQELNELDNDLIKIFCANTAIAFDNIILNQDIEKTQKEIILTLGEIAEARSMETGCHVKRVAEYSKLLAQKMGLSESDVELIHMASPMHDVGKLAIPDAVLNKPGKLTPEEYDVMKPHAKIGHDMLMSSSRHIIQAGALIALTHHEKYDGTGYPKQLKGEQIPIFGRITAIADVFDALASNRVYKKAWEMERILNLIRSEKGKHFDPVLVDIFLENIEEILKIREISPD